MRACIQFRWAGVAILATFAFGAWIGTTAQAATWNYPTIIVHDSEPVTFSWYDGVAAGADTLWTFNRWEDCNQDSDLRDTLAGCTEKTNIYNLQLNQQTQCVSVGQFECEIVLNGVEITEFIWRANRTDHIPGNYSLRVVARNAATATIATLNVGFQILPDASAVDVAQHQGTRALVNQSYANVSQNISYLNNTQFPYTWDLVNLTGDQPESSFGTPLYVPVDQPLFFTFAPAGSGYDQAAGDTVTWSLDIWEYSDQDGAGTFNTANLLILQNYEEGGVGGCTTQYPAFVGEQFEDHFACNGGLFDWDFEWLLGSTLRESGRNYTLHFTSSTAGFATISSSQTFSVHFINATTAACDSSCSTAQHEGTRALVNETTGALSVEHAAQDLTHPTPGGCDEECQGNIANSTSASVSTMGIDLGDELTDGISFGAALLILAWLIAFIWCASNQWMAPAVLAFLGMMLPLVVNDVGLAMRGLFLLWAGTLVLTWIADRFELRPWRTGGG